MKKDMPLEGLRWSRDSGSALYDTPQNGRSRTGWGGSVVDFYRFIEERAENQLLTVNSVNPKLFFRSFYYKC